MGDLPGKLDRLVHRTRLDFMTPMGSPRPRNLRWLPMLVLLALPAGYALLVWSLHHVAPGRGLGWAAWLSIAGLIVYAAALVAATVIALFGPRVGRGVEGLDERELMLRARAGNVSGQVIAALATLACFYGAGAATFGLWSPVDAVEWVNLGLIVSAYARLLPVLVASWLQPQPDAEE